MKAALETDVVVIGAGVVGAAVAARLAGAGLAVVVLERHPGFGWEASSRNSEVIHAGMYYPVGSLKARSCVAGNRSLREWCERHRVDFEMIGKFIVAVTDDEVEELERILARGRANGVRSLDWAADGHLRSAEPNVRAVAALWSPETGIIDSHGLMASLVDAAERSDAAFVYGARYESAQAVPGGFMVHFIDTDGEAEQVRAARVVNAGGLDADVVAAGAGVDVDGAGYRLCYVRGSYFRLSESKAGVVRHLIYPVPPAGLAGLGIHVTLDLAGSIRFGPHVDPLPTRTQDYHVDPALADVFAAAASRYLPGIVADDLRPDQSGIRARRIVPGGGAPDFLLSEERSRGLPGWVNMIGIESPGLTCCLELADHVAALLDVQGPRLGSLHEEMVQ